MFCHDLANLKHEFMTIMTENSLSEMCHCVTAKLAPDISKKYTVIIFKDLGFPIPRPRPITQWSSVIFQKNGVLTETAIRNLRLKGHLLDDMHQAGKDVWCQCSFKCFPVAGIIHQQIRSLGYDIKQVLTFWMSLLQPPSGSKGSKKSVIETIYQWTHHHIPEDLNLHQHCYKNHSSRIMCQYLQGSGFPWLTWSAAGLSAITSDASFRARDAFISPSAAITFARASRAASASAAIARWSCKGRRTSFL